MDNENIKKGSALLFLLLATPCLVAEEFSHSMCTISEYYLGFGLGPETGNFKQKAYITGPSFNAIDKNQFATKKGKCASLFGGVGFRFPVCDPNCDRIYFGIEANVNVRTLAHKLKNRELIRDNFNHTYYKMHRDLGISVLPGILISNCSLFYGRFGYARGRFKVDTTDTSLQNIFKTRTGLRYGLGLRQSINECLAFRLEYGQTNYKKLKMFTFDPVGNVAKTTFITPHIQRFELGVLYNF